LGQKFAFLYFSPCFVFVNNLLDSLEVLLPIPIRHLLGPGLEFTAEKLGVSKLIQSETNIFYLKDKIYHGEQQWLRCSEA